MTDGTKKTPLELVVELIKALAWPVVAIVLLTSFWGPLQRTADLIPSIVGRSDTITIAGLSLKVSPGLRAKATPEVAAVLAGISKSGLERVLEMGSSSYWDKNSVDNGRDSNRELIKLGLAREIPKAELEELNSKEGRVYGFGVRRTELGDQTQQFLRSVVAEFAQEVAREAPSSK